jgi:hypothetical protein
MAESQFFCSICRKPVILENAKINADGKKASTPQASEGSVFHRFDTLGRLRRR